MMNLGAIFIGLALLVLVTPLVVDPFRKRPGRGFADTLLKSTDVDGFSGDALLALRDLEFDYQTEKITDEDYQKIRTELLTQAAEAIETQQKEDTRIEELIQARRIEKTSTTNCTQCSKPLRDRDKFCSECGHAFTILCSSCGRENHAEDNFCTKCGQSLIEQTTNS